jgi:hypothetical protein
VTFTEEFSQLDKSVKWAPSGFEYRAKQGELIARSSLLGNFLFQHAITIDRQDYFCYSAIYQDCLYRLLKSGWIIKTPITVLHPARKERAYKKALVLD